MNSLKGGGGLQLPDILKKTLVIVVNVPPLMSLLGWSAMCMLSIFFFDSGKTSLPTLGLALAILVYPCPVCIGLWRTWKAYRSCDYAGCVRSTLLTYSGAIFIGVMFGIIMTICGGKFAC